MYFVCVYRGEKLVGFVRDDGTFAELQKWAYDCKHTSERAAEKAKIEHVCAYARQNVGHFPFSYLVSPCL